MLTICFYSLQLFAIMIDKQQSTESICLLTKTEKKITKLNLI
jgi:hypothetical protein